MKYITHLWFVFMLCFCCSADAKSQDQKQNFILSTHTIQLKGYPNAFNPSIIKTKKGFLLSFRHCLAPQDPEVSYIGVVALDETLTPISKPQLLNTRPTNSRSPSRSEDARIFSYNNQLYVVYNDKKCPRNQPEERRDMFIAKVQYNQFTEQFYISETKKLCYTDKYETRKVEKNWSPFVWKKNLLFIYTGCPHEIIYPNLKSGECVEAYTTAFMSNWKWGEIRGGTPGQLVDGEYLTFFHSMKVTSSEASNGVPMFHYYMGAYTFSSEPPFEVEKVSSAPIIGKNFYTRSKLDKRVIFPGGFAVKGPHIYLAYGKDDNEICVAIIDKAKLKASLLPCRGL